MKDLTTIVFILLTLGTTYNDDNLYTANLSEIVVIGDILEGYVPKRASTWSEKEFIEINKPIIQYLAKNTWLEPQQIYAALRMEQGRGSHLLIKHNNPLNIKSSNGVTASTWEFTRDNVVDDRFASYSTLREGLEATVKLLNGKYYHEPTDDETACYHIYNTGWHTDPNVKGRIKLTKNYKRVNTEV